MFPKISEIFANICRGRGPLYTFLFNCYKFRVRMRKIQFHGNEGKILEGKNSNLCLQ